MRQHARQPLPEESSSSHGMPSSVAVLRDAENVTVFTVSPEAGADDILQASLSFIRAPTRLALMGPKAFEP